MVSRKTALAAALSMLCTGAIASPTTLASLSLGDNSAGIAFDPVLRHAFVTNYDDGTLSEIDVDTLQLTATIPAGQRPRRIVSNAALNRVYFVNDTTPGQLTVLDATNNAVVARIDVGNRPRNVAADFQKGEVYVSNRDSDSLSIIDVATNSVVAIAATGRGPGGVEVNSTAGRIYVPSAQDGTLTVIDQNTRDVQWSVAVGRNPGAATADERTGKVYVNNIDDKTVSVLDSDGKLIATLPVGAGSTFGTVSAVYHRYYLPNAADGTLTIVDTDHDVVTNTLAVGASPQQAIVDAASGRIYVVNRAGGTVSVVDAATESTAGQFDVGSTPWRIASAMDKLFVLNENGNTLDSLTVAAEPPADDPTAIVTEYYNAASGRYFHTADPLEIRWLNDGVFGNEWNRTMRFWRVWTTPAPGRVPVCRFDGAGADATSHAYVPFASECETLKSSGTWHYEGVGYYVSLPDASGVCSSGADPLFRLQIADENGTLKQRFTVEPAVLSAMEVGGWTPKDYERYAVFACVPQLVAKEDIAVVADRVLEKPMVRPVFHKPFPNVHLP